jgi:hypothetical protein
MKHFLKIKRVMVFDDGEFERVVIRLRCGDDVVKSGNDYINVQTGEVYEPLFDEFTEELIGFIG